MSQNLSQIKYFTTALDILFLAILFLKSNFYGAKLDKFKFYACNKMYIKAATVSNDIKIAYFSKTDFERNLLRKMRRFAEHIS